MLKTSCNNLAKVQDIQQDLIPQNPSTCHSQFNWESRLVDIILDLAGRVTKHSSHRKYWNYQSPEF